MADSLGHILRSLENSCSRRKGASIFFHCVSPRSLRAGGTTISCMVEQAGFTEALVGDKIMMIGRQKLEELRRG